MAKFLTGDDLNSELGKLFDGANEQIILISPYIKLHDRYASIFRAKLNNPKIQIIIVFGKNEKDLSKSINQEDFNFFKEFPNIEIRYEKRLHAKYYSSESSAILTSMNLYDYSQDHNIEAGVLTAASLLGNIANNLLTNVTGEDSFDRTAQAYFTRVIEQSELLFRKVPEYEITMLGLSKKYKTSRTEVDKLTNFFLNKPRNEINTKQVETKSTFNKPEVKQMGYCIRTGAKVPFSIEKPMTDEAWKSWSKYKDPNYAEKYCHYSGDKSNGETSVKKPILSKYYRQAKETFNLK